MPDGCEPHNITAKAVDRRWVLTEETINATPPDDHEAQASIISMCICCLGPCKIRFVSETPLCKRCSISEGSL